MSLIQYTVVVRFTAEATDLINTQKHLDAIANFGEVVETKARTVSAKAKVVEANDG